MISILLDSRKDIFAGKMFLDVLGHDYLKNLSFSTQEFFQNNVNFIRRDSTVSQTNNFEYYYPFELDEKDICFVDDEAKFKEMLDHFETTKPNIIGKKNLNYVTI